MKVAIMQPYFFPYIGYFQLIAHADLFILLDEVQFIRHGWIERNRILKPSNEPLYIKVPILKKSSKSLIREIDVNNSLDWRNKIFAQLEPYKKVSRNYEEIILFLKEAFKIDTESLVKLNNHLLIKSCEYLNINTPIKTFSSMKLEIEDVNASDEWALNICKALNAKSYINPPGGINLFDKGKFNSNNIELKFLSSNLKAYNQFMGSFVSGLSIIDVMMFNSKEEVLKMLNEYELIE